ncbi:MAG: hypothetical protein FWG98_00420 [Candidatus Cloacimonetes bacterium]|nr:hypothetical protein [Candidatus Cloacimonadota bacterium]
MRDLATTGCESSQGRESDTEIASGGDSSEGPRNDGLENLARTGKEIPHCVGMTRSSSGRQAFF